MKEENVTTLSDFSPSHNVLSANIRPIGFYMNGKNDLPLNYYIDGINITPLMDSIRTNLKEYNIDELTVVKIQENEELKNELKIAKNQNTTHNEILFNLSEQLDEAEQINKNNENNILTILSELENNLENNEFVKVLKASKTLEKLYCDSLTEEWNYTDESDDEDVYIKGNN